MIETITIDTEQWAVVPRVLLEEITESLACELDARYPACNRSYPSQERKYLAEMEPVIKAREILAAAPRPEAGQQDAAVTDYGSIDQSHEFIQLFNAAFEALKHGHSIGVCWDLMKAARAELSKHAKQRPAPRPVPTDMHATILELCDTLENRDDIPLHKWALKSAMLVSKIRTGLTRPAEPDGGAV